MLKPFQYSVLCLLLLLSARGAAAQTPAPPPAPPKLVRVFLDCQYECDTEYILQNITFVDYVRDRTVSDLHILVTTEGTGGGGTAWTLKFIGQGFFQGQDRTLMLTTPRDATSDQRRRAFSRVLRIGLVGYAASTESGALLDVTSSQPTAANKTAPMKDRWNFWVFNIGGGGYMSGEASSNNQSHNFNASGSRTTEQWKVNISTYKSSDSSTFKISDTDTVKSNSDNWSFNTLVVKSLGPKWSVGQRSSLSHSSYSNTNRSINLAPTLEYDFFPYSVSARRSLTVQYTAGATAYNYRELTIFNKLKETVPSHSVNVYLGVRAPWGTLNGSVNISENLNHLDQYHVGLRGGTSVRLFKGFSFNVNGGYNRIHDQIGLPKADATTEEVLLRLQQRATGYSYNMNFGLSYSFGSIFNSVVNPRFGGGNCCF